MASIRLRPHQVEHFARIQRVCAKSPVYVDTSKMGRGKSFVVGALAQSLGLPLLIIGPKTVESVWNSLCRDHAIRKLGFLSYQSLRSTKNHKPGHGLLTRQDTSSSSSSSSSGGPGGGSKKTTEVTFAVTAAAKLLFQTGLILVLDEFQNVKNKTAQMKAVVALVQGMRRRQGGPSGGSAPPCLCALLSGSPFDKEQHCLSFYRVLGMMVHDSLAAGTPAREWLGFQEIVEHCLKLDPENTRAVLGNTSPTSRAKVSVLRRLSFQLLVQVVKPALFSCMPAPEQTTVKMDVKNAFYRLDAMDLESLERHIQQLAGATGYNDASGAVKYDGRFIGTITPALMGIEMAKVNAMARVATSILLSQCNGGSGCAAAAAAAAATTTRGGCTKVVICVSYNQTIAALTNKLRAWRPASMNGATSATARKKLIETFQMPDSVLRVLICNTMVGGIGISLHDTDGRFPRSMLISSSYSMLNVYQATGRICREGTTSDACVRIVYGHTTSDRNELGILTAMAQKSDVLTALLADDEQPGASSSSVAILPGGYVSWDEVTDTTTEPLVAAPRKWGAEGKGSISTNTAAPKKHQGLVRDAGRSKTTAECNMPWDEFMHLYGFI